MEEADIINRFEIRLRNERAYYAVRDLLTYYDAEQTAFSIINQYVRFVDEEPDKRKNDWKLNDRWAWFIGDNRQSLKLTTKPEPFADEVHEHTSVYQLNELDFMYRQLSNDMQEEYTALLTVYENLEALYICRNVIKQ